jgi:hypothetical protein
MTQPAFFFLFLKGAVSGIMRLIKDRKSQMGVFMFLILVSLTLVGFAAAWTVILSSAILEKKAQATVEEVPIEPPRAVEIMRIIGHSNKSKGEITALILSLRLPKKSEPVDYRDLIMGYQSTDYYHRGITYGGLVEGIMELGEKEHGRFYVKRIRDIGEPDEILEASEILEIYYRIGDSNGNDTPLLRDTGFMVTIQSTAGYTAVNGTVPSRINNRFIELYGG